MKQNILTILLCSLICLSATTIQTLTQRSTAQVVFHDTNANRIQNTINNYYKAGYRITSITSQPLFPQIEDGYTRPYSGIMSPEILKGEILVVMEK